MYEITKADWKLLQEKLPGWQERYMERLLSEYAHMIENRDSASAAFWELEERISSDKRHPGVGVVLRKSDALSILKCFISDSVISFDDLEGFSDSLIEFLSEC